MRTFTLPLLIALASAGSAYADQTPNQTDNRVDNYQTSKADTQSIYKDDSIPAQDPSLNSVKNETKSLKERERERKGLPRYWNG